jgi:hypothetical protein
MEIPCYWRQLGGSECSFVAQHIIIYSCWNAHICELAVCNTHMGQWESEFHQYWLYCLDCESEIVEWDHVDVKKITVRYANQRKLRT